MLNVLVDKIDVSTLARSGISFENVWKLSDAQNHDYFYCPNKSFNPTIYYRNNSWFLNSKKLKIQILQFDPMQEKNDNYIVYKNNQYSGNILVCFDNQSILIINQILLEDYVKAVIAKEVFPGWHEESLKAIAIVARTYAMHLREEANKKNKLYHITNTIKHQKYEGIQFHESIEKAVDQTKNMIIIDKIKKKPILAMYHVCCGGVIPIECVGFDFNNHPYLKRKNQCTGCKDYKFFNWKKEISYMDFLNKLKEVCDDKNIIKLNRIIRKSYSKTGTVRRLCIEVEVKKNKKGTIKKTITLNNKMLRKIFDIKLSQYSSYFNLTYDEAFNFIIEGKGQGHHIGLCQRGMYEYSKQGKKFYDIIAFYYPQTKIINFFENGLLSCDINI